MRTTHLIRGILAGLLGCVQSAFAAVPTAALPLEDGSLLLVAAAALVAAIKIAKCK